MYKKSAGPCTNMQRVAGVRLGPDSNNNGMEEGEQMLSFNSQSFQLFNVFRSLSLSPFSLYISKFPFYIQRHYRKAFNSSHNVLCIWILKEEMETFFCWLLLFFHSQAKKNFGLALLSLKSVLGKKLCLHYDQIGTTRYTWVWITYSFMEIC